MILTASPGHCLARLRHARHASSRIWIFLFWSMVMQSRPQDLAIRFRKSCAGIMGLHFS